MKLELSNPAFWTLIEPHHGALMEDGSLRYVMLTHQYQMKPLLRTREELFTATLLRAGTGLKVCVNGSYYDVSTAGLADVAWGNDPVDPAATTLLGEVHVLGTRIAGGSQRQRFYIAQVKAAAPSGIGWTYRVGFGDPPAGVLAAVGGLGPLLWDGLRYGAGNLYSAGTIGPVSGEPPAFLRSKLIQRNNENFRSANSRPPATGKTVIASHTAKQKLLVAVQPHALAPGQTYAWIAGRLVDLGFDQGVFLDGSDSALLMLDGKLVIRPGEDKDESNTLGVGFGT